jgi:glyoxylase-like metal-dependent hydrolase (beta-lactamase superfamily II)
MKKDFTPEDELLFLALGGSGEIGMNVNLYGCRGKWLMVDLGMSFGAAEYPGTELMFADPEFIEDRADDLLGIVLTHAHEDHIGAVAHLWPRFKAPIFATPFTAFILREKLREADLLDQAAGRPALLVEGIAYGADGVPIEFARSYVRGDRTRYYVERLVVRSHSAGPDGSTAGTLTGYEPANKV